MEPIAESDPVTSSAHSIEGRYHRCGHFDAAMTPYHVARSKLFVRERFGKEALSQLDILAIEANIEHTRFPVPNDEQHSATDDFPGLLRAAVLLFLLDRREVVLSGAYARVTGCAS
jgi:hypothetical protein